MKKVIVGLLLVTVMTAVFALSDGPKKVLLAWEPVVDCSYNVYRKAAGDTNYRRIGITESINFIDTNIDLTTYTYAVTSVDTARVESDLSTIATFDATVNNDNIVRITKVEQQRDLYVGITIGE